MEWLVTSTTRRRLRLGARAFPSCRGGGKLQALLARALPLEGARPAAPAASGEMMGRVSPGSPARDHRGHPRQVPPGLKEKPEVVPKEESDITSSPGILEQAAQGSG